MEQTIGNPLLLHFNRNGVNVNDRSRKKEAEGKGCEAE